MINDINKPEQIHLNFNASKIRWLSSSKIAPTNVFCIGSGENLKKLSLWKAELNSDAFKPTILCESEDLDGDVTQLKAKSTEELFASSTNGSIYYYKYFPNEQKLLKLNKWSSNNSNDHNDTLSNDFVINDFDFNSDFDEICTVSENGSINLIRANNDMSSMQLLNNDLSSLNSVLYLKQYEIAVADCLGKIKLWDTRHRDCKKPSMTLSLEGECSPIMCLSNHPNQQHIVACGNLNGLIFIYDVRSNKKPFIMCHTHSEPTLEVCFHPFSCDNLISCSFSGGLWYWNASSKEFSNWDDRSVNAKNFLPNNRYAINSFDINNENIIAVNNNYGLYKIKNHSFI